MSGFAGFDYDRASRRRRRGALTVGVALTFGVVACSGSVPASVTPPVTPSAAPATVGAHTMDEPAAGSPEDGQQRLADDPVRVADDLVADQLVLRDPTASEAVLVAAAHRQQAAYRSIGRHPEWDAVVRPLIPPASLDAYDRNVDARRQLTAMAQVKDTLPAWRIQPPAPAEDLLAFYREAEAATGVAWNYLAAINLVETRFGSVDGVSTAGARGPMQFLPSTFAAYGEGGDIESPRDSILAAGRYLAANDFTDDHDGAVHRYNHADEYVRAVDDYAAVLAADPAAFGDYYRWDVYYYTTSGDVLLPIGYLATTPVPVADYLATHPR